MRKFLQWPFALAILATALFSVEVSSQEISIGHLETKDDPDAISSWVFFNCNRNGPAMICDTFQTLISDELLPEQRASDIEKQMQGDPVKEFRDGFGKECQGWAQASSPVGACRHCRGTSQASAASSYPNRPHCPKSRCRAATFELCQKRPLIIQEPPQN
jgi:hypothetical protein